MYRYKFGDATFNVINYIFMLILFIFAFYPFIYVLSCSLSDASKLTGEVIFYPVGLNLESYKTCLGNEDIYYGFMMSILRTTVGPLSMIIVTSMGAYVLTKDELFGIKFFRLFFLFTMYFSGGLIPTYILMKMLHLTGSFFIYILPSLVNVFNMILIKTYIEGIPKSLEDAAMVDGANTFTTFFKILFPICLPVSAAVILFSAITHWNSYIDTMLYNSMNPKLYTLQYLLFNIMAFQNNTSLEISKQNAINGGVTPETVKMAITIIVVIPIMVVYPFLQKYFVTGLMIGSIKG